MSRKFVMFTLLAALLALMPLSPTSVRPMRVHAAQTFADAKAVDAQMTALMSKFLIPGAGLALIKDGQIVYTKGYGNSNIAQKQTVTDESTFAIGSISKSFTALAIMQLVEVGKIELDAPVIRYLPEFKLAEPSYTPLLTVRHLLNQTSGLPRADELWGLSLPVSRDQVIADVAKIKPTARPGEVWQYCNQNFAIAGAILEAVSGTTYEAYLQKNVFDPLGMASANLTIEELFKSNNPALPYQLDVFNGYAPIPVTTTGYQAVKMLAAAGAINANVKDMAAYALMQLGKGKQLVSAKSLELMHSKQVKIMGQPEGDSVAAISMTSDIGYGFGWFPETYRGKLLVGHGGSIEGYTSHLTFVPSDGVAVVILNNSVATGYAFNEAVRLSMLELLLGLKPTPNMAEEQIKRLMLDMDGYAKNVALAKAYHANPADLEKYNGDYEGVTGKFSLTAHGEKLVFRLAPPATIEIDLIPLAPDKFIVNGSLNSLIEVKTDADGLVIYQDGAEVARPTDRKMNTTTYTDPKGRYSLPIAASLTVEQKGDLTLIAPSDKAYTVTIGTLDLNTDEATTISGLAARQTPAITAKPLDVRPIPAGALTWTQYVYQVTDQSVFVVEALTQGKTVYFITVAGDQAAIAKATPVLNTMLIGFKLN